MFSEAYASAGGYEYLPTGKERAYESMSTKKVKSGEDVSVCRG